VTVWYPAASAWNIAYDAGLGLGAAAIGGLAGHGAAILAVAASAAFAIASAYPVLERLGQAAHDHV
jgi:hypothetical protein